VYASGLHASFEGMPDVCVSNMFTDKTTVIELCADNIDASNNWKDTSGPNLIQQSEALDNVAWTKATVTVTTDQVRFRDGVLGAEKLAPTAADSYLYQDVAGSVGQKFYCMFDLRSVTGNVSLSIHIYDQAHGTILGTQAITVTPFWQLFRVEGVLVAGDTHVGCTLGGNSTWSTGEDLYGGRAWLVDEDVDGGIGVYHTTTTTTKPRLDLTPTNAPTLAKSDRQRVDGNRVAAREFNGIDQYDSKAHHDSMNVFDGDFTLTLVAMRKTGGPASPYMFSHGLINTDGFGIQYGTNAISACFNKATAQLCATGITHDDYYDVVHVVRSGNNATVYVNNVAGTPVNVSTYGIDGARNLRIAEYETTGTYPFPGDISYIHLRAKALSAKRLAYEREVLLAIASNMQTNAFAVGRATTAYTAFADETMAEVAPHMPRVGGGGGALLIESQGQNLVFQSQDFSTTWTTGFATVSTNVIVAPDGQTTVDGIVGAAVENIHGVAQNEIDLTVDSYVFHVRAKPGNQDWLYLQDTTVANAYAYFNIANGFVGTVGAGAVAKMKSGWNGFYHCWIVFTGTAAQHTVLVYSAEADGDNQFLGDGSTINTYVWQAQVEKGAFPTSIVPTTTASVTRNADSVTLDPHPGGDASQRVLPDKFEPNTNRDKLTVRLDAKCLWEGSADIGEERILLSISGNSGTASGTRNRFYMYVAAAGRLFGSIRDDADVDHLVYTAIDPIDFSNWFTVRFFVDFSDLSRIDMWSNGSNSGMTYIENSGSGTFDTTGTHIRLGQNYAGTVDGNCKIRNPHVWSGKEVWP